MYILIPFTITHITRSQLGPFTSILPNIGFYPYTIELSSLA